MEGVAVWVQAVGSVLAIWAAARLVVFQQRSQAVERLEAIYGLAVTSAEQIDTAASVVREAAKLGPEMLADYPVRRSAATWPRKASPATTGAARRLP